MLNPLGTRILVKPAPNPDQTDSGLHLVEHRKPETSGVVARVPSHARCECPDCGHSYFRPSSVVVGETVVFSWQAGLEVFIDDERYLIIDEADIAAVLEEAVA